MTTIERLLRSDRCIIMVMVGLVVLLAATYTIFGVGMNMSAIEMTQMAGPAITAPDNARIATMSPMTPASWSPAYAGVVFLMWWFMMIAMMVPSAAPVILLYARLASGMRDRRPAGLLAGFFLAGYILTWSFFSVLATALQWALNLRGLVGPDTMALTSTLLAGTAVLLAGIYQFTPLKRTCQEHCRSPVQFLVAHHRPGLSGAVRMGAAHGTFCLGCCWFLMGLLFVGGIMNLYWIAGLVIFVALEKLVNTSKALSYGAGVILIGIGAWQLVFA